MELLLMGMVNTDEITNLLGNFTNDTFCCFRATHMPMKTLETGKSNRNLSNA